jgi:hypothetical protein
MQEMLDEIEHEIDSKDSVSDAIMIMSDEYALPDVPGYKPRSFDSSNFKREYDWAATKPLQNHQKDRLLMAVRTVIEGYCTRNNLDPVRGQNFQQKLHSECQLTADRRGQCCLGEALDFRPGIRIRNWRNTRVLFHIFAAASRRSGFTCSAMRHYCPCA